MMKYPCRKTVRFSQSSFNIAINFDFLGLWQRRHLNSTICPYRYCCKLPLSVYFLEIELVTPSKPRRFDFLRFSSIQSGQRFLQFERRINSSSLFALLMGTIWSMCHSSLFSQLIPTLKFASRCFFKVRKSQPRFFSVASDLEKLFFLRAPFTSARTLAVKANNSSSLYLCFLLSLVCVLLSPLSFGFKLYPLICSHFFSRSCI